MFRHLHAGGVALEVDPEDAGAALEALGVPGVLLLEALLLGVFGVLELGVLELELLELLRIR